MTYLIEIIDNDSKLYYRIHRQYFRDGELSPSVFKETGLGNQKSMSADWEKYSTPHKSRMRARKPELNGIAHFIAGKLRNLTLRVTHAPRCDPDPEKDNQAHTDVNGTDRPIDDDSELRLKLLDEITWDIYPSDSVQ